MSSNTFFDSNVLIYSVSVTEPRRQQLAVALLAGGGRVSVQVLNEFASVARRKMRRTWPEISQALADIRKVCLPPLALTTQTHERAIDLANMAGFAFYDALIVASALEAGCTTLLSEDMQDGQVVDRQLTIRNPFRAA